MPLDIQAECMDSYAGYTRGRLHLYYLRRGFLLYIDVSQHETSFLLVWGCKSPVRNFLDFCCLIASQPAEDVLMVPPSFHILTAFP